GSARFTLPLDLPSVPTRRSSDLEKRRVTTTLFLRQHVHLRLKLGVRRDRPRLRQHLTTLHLVAAGTTQQHTDVVARLPLIQQLRSEEHTSELQSRENLVCRLLLE